MSNAWQKRKLTLTWATLECLFFGGMIGGWLRFLLPVLVENSYFAELCPLDSENLTLEEALEEFNFRSGSEDSGHELRYAGGRDLASAGRGGMTSGGGALTSGGSAAIPGGGGSKEPTAQRQYYKDAENYEYSYSEYYYEVSPYTNITCARQRYELGQVYTVALVAASIMAVFGGTLYDSCGTLRTRLVTTLMLTAATLFMAFTGPDHSWFLYPMATMMATSGFMLVLTCLQIGNLFDSCRHTAIALLIGASDSGRAIMFVMRTSSEGGLGIQHSFMFISVHIIPLLIGTIAMFPHRWIKWPLPEDMITNRANPQITLNGIRRASMRARLPHRAKKKDTPILALLGTRIFLSQMTWFAVMTLRLFHYEYHLLNQLGPVETDEVDHYLQVFDYTQVWGIVITPCMGAMLDMNTSDLSGHSRKQQVMYNSCMGHSLATLAMAILSALTLLPRLVTIYLAFLLHAVCRPLVYTLTVSTLATIFPPEYLGRLVGFSHAGLAMVLLCVELPLRVLSQQIFNSQTFWTNLVLFFLTMSVCFHPYMVKHHGQPNTDQNKNSDYDKDDIELGGSDYKNSVTLVPQRLDTRSSIGSEIATAQIDV